jgi:uncharacterized iron-regulated protein
MTCDHSRRTLLLGPAGIRLGMALHGRTALGALAAVGSLGALGGCASLGVPTPAPVRLWGEVHDHPQLHAQRLVAFDALLAAGERPALVLEMIDRDRQTELERLRGAGADATALVATLGGRGWHWPFYQPYIERALRLGLPLVAANVGRDEARRVMADGLAAHGFEASVPPPLLATQAALIEASHCGVVDGPRAARMALAQVARDQAMARAVQAHAGRGVLLLAGNGHVRRDIGVPVWLQADLRQRVQVMGWVERGDAVAAFDERRVFDPHPRPDPCASMRAPR